MELTKLSAAKLREILSNDYGLSSDEIAALKDKAALVNAIQTEMLSLSLDKIQLEEELVDKIKDREDREDLGPHYMDKDWSNHVLSLLLPTEKDEEGNPRVFGLRRLAETLLGDIVDSGPIREHILSEDSTCVIYQMVFDWRIAKQGEYYDIRGMELPRRVFRASASCTHSNMPDSRFNIFSLAVAETRSEARCLKKALGLTCITAEEKGLAKFSEITQSSEWSESDNITTPQSITIKSKVNSLKLDLDKFLGEKKIESLTKGEALEKIQLLDSYVRDLNCIPQEIKNV